MFQLNTDWMSVLYLVLGDETLSGQLVFAIIVDAHQAEGLGQPGLQF